MKAAKNFTVGLDPEEFDNPGDARKTFKMGEEVPDDIADQLPDEFFLEKLRDSDPNSLSREQLLALLDMEDNVDIEPEEFDEDQFREGMKDFRNKQDLIDWANGMGIIQLEKDDGSREELEDWITLAAQGIDPFEDDDDDEE